jgi:hypothetical protein
VIVWVQFARWPWVHRLMNWMRSRINMWNLHVTSTGSSFSSICLYFIIIICVLFCKVVSNSLDMFSLCKQESTTYCLLIFWMLFSRCWLFADTQINRYMHTDFVSLVAQHRPLLLFISFNTLQGIAT